MVQLIGVDDREDRLAGLIVSDSLPGGEGHRRMLAGRGQDGASTIELMDASGQKRLILKVTADGRPSISFVDANGKVVDATLPASLR